MAQERIRLRTQVFTAVHDMMVQVAQSARDEALEVNRRILGHTPEYETFVDGRPGAREESVQPGGNILYLFSVHMVALNNAIEEIFENLVRISPVGTPPKDSHPGLYRSSHVVMVNNQEIAFEEIPTYVFQQSDSVSFTNLLPYARRIEKNWSKQTTNGVYEATYDIIQAKYSDLLRMNFTYEEYPGFEIGKTKVGNRLTTRADFRRARSYPTIRISVLSADRALRGGTTPGMLDVPGDLA